jgi:hypothetical protein
MAVLSFQRKVLILGICIVVLAGIYVLGSLFSPARVGQREAALPLLVEFNKLREQVVEIRLSTDEGSLNLVMKGDSWVVPEPVQDHPASQVRINSFLDFLADTSRSRLVTDNPEAWEEFQVGSDSANRVILLDSSGKNLADIIVGKTATGSQKHYVRLADSNEVLLTNRSFDFYLSIEEKFWSYLRIFPEDLEGQSIMRFTVDSSLQLEELGSDPLQYTLVLSADQPAVWKRVDVPEADLDNNKVDQLVDNLADLEGTEFAHGIGFQQAGLTDPAARILISTLDDRDFRLLIGGEAGEEQYYTALENGTFVYKVSTWKIKNILKSIEDLRGENE